MKRYCITTFKNSNRIMLYPHNANGTHKTERAARDHLIAIISNNNNSDIESILGDASKVEIRPVDCYKGGDPKQTIFN